MCCYIAQRIYRLTALEWTVPDLCKNILDKKLIEQKNFRRKSRHVAKFSPLSSEESLFDKVSLFVSQNYEKE